MKLATLTASVLAVLACGAVLGCSSGRSAPPDTGARDTGVVVRVDAPFTPVDAPISTTPDSPPPRVDAGRDSGTSGRVCVATCTSDAQCATSCPANPLGANCCDTTSRTCFAATTAVCPVTTPDDGGMTMY